MTWSSRPTAPDTWELCWTPATAETGPFRVGQCCWLHLPTHPAVAMQRIIDQLNSSDHTHGSEGGHDGWWCEVIGFHPDQSPAMWVTFWHQDIEAMVLAWDQAPNNPPRWHSRIVTALSPHGGLPEVACPTPRRTA